MAVLVAVLEVVRQVLLAPLELEIPHLHLHLKVTMALKVLLAAIELVVVAVVLVRLEIRMVKDMAVMEPHLASRVHLYREQGAGLRV